MKLACRSSSSPVLLPGGIRPTTLPRPGLHPRGWRAGLRSVPCLRRRDEQPALFVPAIVPATAEGCETGPLVTGWQSNKLINPRTDGMCCLPIALYTASQDRQPDHPVPHLRRRAARSSSTAWVMSLEFVLASTMRPHVHPPSFRRALRVHLVRDLRDQGHQLRPTTHRPFYPDESSFRL